MCNVLRYWFNCNICKTDTITNPCSSAKTSKDGRVIKACSKSTITHNYNTGPCAGYCKKK